MNNYYSTFRHEMFNFIIQSSNKTIHSKENNNLGVVDEYFIFLVLFSEELSLDGMRFLNCILFIYLLL